MGKLPIIINAHLLVATCLFTQIAFSATTVTLFPSADTTLFAESGDLASGLDDSVFVGRNGNAGGFAERRAILRFDLSGIPANAVIQSASVSLTLTRTNASDVPIGLHRVVQDWGEGTSTAPVRGGGQGGCATINSATWQYRFYTTSTWNAAGANYAATPSATTVVGITPLVTVTWASNSVNSDVQAWVQAPSTNFGWILRETNPAQPAPTAKRFASREFATVNQRPQLQITYDIPVAAQKVPLPLWAMVVLGGALVVCTASVPCKKRG